MVGKREKWQNGRLLNFCTRWIEKNKKRSFMAFKKAWRTLVLFQMNLVGIENLKYHFKSNLV